MSDFEEFSEESKAVTEEPESLVAAGFPSLPKLKEEEAPLLPEPVVEAPKALKRLTEQDVPEFRPSGGDQLYVCWDNIEHKPTECGEFISGVDPARRQIVCPTCKSSTVMPVADSVSHFQKWKDGENGYAIPERR